MLSHRAPNSVPTPSLPTPQGVTKEAITRLKNLLTAGVLAFALFLLGFLDPVDQLSWAFQSRIVHQEPSGDVVFVGTDRDLADPNQPLRREALADALAELNEQGVGRVYINIPFSQASDPQSDAKLAAAIDSLGPRAFIVDRIENSVRERGRIVTTLPEIANDTQRVVFDPTANWMGFVWTSQYAHDIRGKRYPSLAASIGGVSDLRSGRFEVDYAIRSSSIPSIELSDLGSGKNTYGVTGRTVVIGQEANPGDGSIRTPGDPAVPVSYVPIYAAEGLKSGRIHHITPLPAIAVFLLSFALLIILSKTAKRRKISYALIAGSIPASLFIGSVLGIRLELSYCALILVVYAIVRSRARWKERLALVDGETQLPKLQALEEALTSDIHARGHIVVARIHGYEHVLKTLQRGDRAKYILKLVDRLRAADGELTVYTEGHHLAWHSEEEDSGSLAEHLEGMRAMFAAPLTVAGSTVDVGISFGVAKLDGEPSARLAAAVAAAEESSEALQPIKIAESSSRFDELWDISLRARIDEAMDAGEIFCVYQPKVDTRTNTMTGVEALVRWQDPARGFIPPMHFIAQCEKAGRMEALTQYVLQLACTAGRLRHFRGRSITMAVNISATLLSDMKIVGTVRNVLQATGFDPRFLVLEVTETSRIGNLETAEMVLNELKALGARISMDDFGVGETNFETFFELPFDEVKIDRLFIANITKSAKAKAIVTSIVNMGREARIGVVAEGAEDDETLKMLTEIGCTHVQGYVLARPMNLDNIMDFKDLRDSDVQEA